MPTSPRGVPFQECPTLTKSCGYGQAWWHTYQFPQSVWDRTRLFCHRQKGLLEVIPNHFPTQYFPIVVFGLLHKLWWNKPQIPHNQNPLIGLAFGLAYFLDSSLHKHFRRFRFRFCPRQALRLPEHHCLLIDQLVAVFRKPEPDGTRGNGNNGMFVQWRI